MQIHPDIEKNYRDSLKQNLKKCTDQQVMLFKRMYHHKGLEADIEKVVDLISVDKLDWAYTQVSNTLNKGK